MMNTKLGAVVTSQGRGDGQDASTNPGAAKVTSNSLRSCCARVLGDSGYLQLLDIYIYIFF